ncbi:MAG TPA: YheC/YheD family protein [Bacillota bacterium]|nr:YheC/YheD family protein [Bacillota bacterium]
MNTRYTLGILTIHTSTQPPFPEARFFEQMTRVGNQEGIKIIVIHPDAINFNEKKVRGYHWNPNSGWTQIVTTIPEYIYDRCFYFGKTYHKRYKSNVEKLQSLENVHFLGIGLKGKWQLNQLIHSHPIFSSFLPPTEIVKNIEQVEIWLSRYPAIILKPISGSLGIGIMKITRKPGNEFSVVGRDYKNQPYTHPFSSVAAVRGFLLPLMMKYRYLIQPYLSLSTKQGIPFDLRIFIQKDGSGQWTTTGKAIRAGKKNSITSNLHGGGKAYPFEPFLKQNFSEEVVEQIHSRISIIEKLLPSYLEEQHGPLVELGIDIGIDREGTVWLIEVNSRPGRKIFEQINDRKALNKSRTNPLYYAKYLIQSQIGG